MCDVCGGFTLEGSDFEKKKIIHSFSMADSRLACWAQAPTAYAASLSSSVGTVAGIVVGSSSPSSFHPACISVSHHLGTGGPALPRDWPLASGVGTRCRGS